MYLPIDGPNTYTNINVGTTAVELKVGASALEERKVVIIQPLGNRIYFGYNNSVTTANGIEVSKRQVVILEAGPEVAIWAIANTGTIDVRIQELA